MSTRKIPESLGHVYLLAFVENITLRTLILRLNEEVMNAHGGPRFDPFKPKI